MFGGYLEINGYMILRFVGEVWIGVDVFLREDVGDIEVGRMRVFRERGGVGSRRKGFRELGFGLYVVFRFFFLIRFSY